MPDDTEAAALHAQLEAIVKKAKDTEAQAVAACRHVQAAHLLFKEEESKAAALEQTATAARQREQSSSSSSSFPAAASQLIPIAYSTYEDTTPLGCRSAQRQPAGEHHPRLLLHQLRQLA
jgi:hypothetical protein